MSFNQTRDLLDVARQFHVHLAELYGAMLDRAATEETRALIGTLIEHEQILEKRLEEYEEEGSANILDTFFKYVVDEHKKCFQEYVLPESLGSMDVIDATRHFDQCLGDFYKEMAEKSLSEHVREVLLNLMQMELREQMNLSRRTLELVASY
jgi:rubrerythrin